MVRTNCIHCCCVNMVHQRSLLCDNSVFVFNVLRFLLLRPRQQLRSTAMSAFVCLSDRISPEPHAWSLSLFVHVAYVRGSVLLRHAYDRPHRLSPGTDFLPPLTMHYNSLAAKGITRSPITSCSTRDHSVAAAFANNGIGWEGGDVSAQRGRSISYDCNCLNCFSLPLFYYCRLLFTLLCYQIWWNKGFQ